MSRAAPALEWHPATAARWPHVERLFGPRGACAGCWCMYWRLPRSEFLAGKGSGNKRSLKALIMKNRRPGILGYLEGDPVAWCAVAPRRDYPGLERSRILRPVDDAPVWSISCLFIARPHRQRGISVSMLEAAIEFARARGGTIVEGYPVEPRQGRMADAFAWTGTASAFQRAGFYECARRSETRPIMRCVIGA